jgi:hypothetical protein
MIPAKGIPAKDVAPHSNKPSNEVLEAVAAAKKPKFKKKLEDVL